MKKAFSLKKKLPKVLAVALAAACFAGAVPANAAGETRAYSTIGSYGSFEEYMWHLSDNTSGDILSFNAENQPVVTKGAGATGTEGTSLASRRIALAAGNYQLSFAVKASSQAYYIVSGYGFDSAGSPKEIKYTNTHEGIIGTEWTSVTAEFTVPEGYNSNEFRLFLRGNSGDRITVKDLDVKIIEENALYAYEPVLDGWTAAGYYDANGEYSDVSLSEEGKSDVGSVHFYQDYTNNTAHSSAYISYMLKGLKADAAYTLEFWLKGNAQVKGDPMDMYLGDIGALWSENGTQSVKLSGINASDWTKYTYEFTTNSGRWVPLRIGAGGYAGADCYIDGISVRENGGDGTNLISNSTFAALKTTLEGWNNGNGYNNPATENAYVAASTDGYSNPGSVHIYTNYANNTVRDTAAIGYCLTATEVGKTYVLEAYIKGSTQNAGDPLSAELRYGAGKWTKTDNAVLKFDKISSDGWTKVEYEFTVVNVGWTQFSINAGGYSGVDCYIDDIKVYEKGGDGTNLISNGTFAVWDTKFDGWNNGNGYNNPATENAYVSLANIGYSNPGSVHIYTNYANNTVRDTAAIGYCLTATEVGKTYVLEAYIKGSTQNAGDPLSAELRYGAGKWTKTDNAVLKFDKISSDGWTKVEYEFTVVNVGWTQFSINAGGYSGVDCYIDDIKVYEKGGGGTNLISNSTFCKTESVISKTSAVDNSPYIVQNVPGFDIGMLNDVLGGDKDISVVPGGSYDGSAAVEIRGGDSAERYFQQFDTDAVKFVLGDTAVKATGYFKVTAGNTEPKIWLGFGKSYGGGNSVGLHFANYLENGKADSGESFTARDDGWYYFEKTVDTGTFNNKINSMTELVWVKYMCGIDARTNTGAARFDNITCEIISSAEPGDANNDGEINILDMVRMKKYSAGNESFENITRGMWLTENTDGAAALAALKKVIIGASSEYGK